MVPSEEDKDRQGSSGIANSLMDPKVRVHAARQAENKRRIKSNPRDDHQILPTLNRAQQENARGIGHQTKDYRSLDAQQSRLQNQNRGSQVGSSEALGRVYALGAGEADQDPNNISDNVDA
ncbi:hypothetical protein Tco_1378212 [Tanacetum coccineum]